MSFEERQLLTLEERLELASRSRAASPEAAAAMVRRLADSPLILFIGGHRDLDYMVELTGELWDLPGVDVDSYRGFIPVYRVAMCRESILHPEDADPLRPVWGTRVSNALVLHGFIMLDHILGRNRNREICHCTKMTGKQYVDALSAVCYANDFERRAFLDWSQAFLKDYGEDLPLSEVMTKILRRYLDGWQEFEWMDHALRCMGSLVQYVEQTGSEEAKSAAVSYRELLGQYGIEVPHEELPKMRDPHGDPFRYFLSRAQGHVRVLPDPGAEIPAGTLRGQAYLPERNYSTEMLNLLYRRAPFPEFQAMLKKEVDDLCLSAAMRKINASVVDLYMLWVEPYLHMRDRTGK